MTFVYIYTISTLIYH